MGNETEYDDEITEEVVLTRWDKIKQWIEIVVATKKVAMLIWSLVFATGGAVIVGEATDTKPIREAAVSIGLLDEKVPLNPAADPYIDELLNLQEDMFRLQDEFKAHKHEHEHDPHTHKVTYEAHEHEPPEFIEHEHEQCAIKGHRHPAVVPVLVKHEHDSVPHDPASHDHPLPAHKHAGDNISEAELAGQLAIDDALLKHIKYDH
jgi:hypothetical protein